GGAWVVELTGGRCWAKSSYFTQHLLPDFVDANPELTANWKVVFDARGRLTEPHTGRRVDLGTQEVRSYTGQWAPTFSDVVHPSPEHDRPSQVPTVGPANRYKFALFIEKEGFDALLAHAKIASRYDLAIMSTKGMSVTACRELVERLTEQGVTILVLHDFDKSVLGILHTL